jgi:hypothetical protein
MTITMRNRTLLLSIGRREGTGKNEGEQPVRQGSGSGRSECAPRRTREKDHLTALNKLAGGRFLATGEDCGYHDAC